MASPSHRLDREHAPVPRVTLPITSRGVVVTDRLCWLALGAAMAVWAVLVLYLTRGTLFYQDQLSLLFQSPDFQIRDAFEPHEGHLGATTHLIFQGALEVFGAGYTTFRILHVAASLVAAGVFYALVKRRIGGLPALAPTLALLFLGAAWSHVLIPIGFGLMVCVAAGLGALVALERGDRRGDVAACALLIVSVATFTTGLAFAVAVAVAILLREDRRQRAWVFLVPIALYGAWWLWSQGEPGSSSDETELANLLLIPNWIADSLAVVLSAISGVGYAFNDIDVAGIEPGWGQALAAVAVPVLVVGLARRGAPRSLWVPLAFLAVFWVLGALAYGPNRVPETARYLYAGTVGVLLVGAEAARGIRFSALGLAALFAACAVSLVTSVALLRDAGAFFRDEYSAPGRTELAMLELARDDVSAEFSLARALPDETPIWLTNPRAGPYLEVVDRFGSPAYTLAEIDGLTEGLRQHADLTLARALDLGVERSPGGALGTDCTSARAGAGGAVAFALAPGGATLRAAGPGSATLTLARFGAEPSVEIGRLPAGEPVLLEIPEDDSAAPWRASVAGARSVEVCAPRR